MLLIKTDKLHDMEVDGCGVKFRMFSYSMLKLMDYVNLIANHEEVTGTFNYRFIKN